MMHPAYAASSVTSPTHIRWFYAWLVLLPLMLSTLPAWSAESAATPPVRMCIDPDWEPLERLTPEGEFIGIAADLLDMIFARVGLDYEVQPSRDWDESLAMAQVGDCDALALLNQTEARSLWLIFTEPYLTDPNVIIARSDHPYVRSLQGMAGSRVALPSGTSIMERVRRDFPDLTVIPVASEFEAFDLIDKGLADFTIRSLTVAAYTIRKEGWFNLRIVGAIPEYRNQLRIGLLPEHQAVRDQLNLAIATLTEQEVQAVLNRHIHIEVNQPRNLGVILVILAASLLGMGLLLAFGLHQYHSGQRLLKLKHQLERTLEAKDEAEAQMHFLARHDSLTGIANRLQLMERLDVQLAQAQRYSHSLAVIFIDLNGFKPVNDTWGHEVGDQLLKAVAQRLQHQLRSTDLLARIGGDEFVVLLPEISNPDEPARVMDKLAAAVAEPFMLNTITLNISASLGLATYPDDGESASELLQHADKAMYRHKAENRQNQNQKQSADPD
ncbi:diguanylate cyclase domain-containing protein [Marinospirillum alkaliphilum]|uniref:Periplasmic/7TM domain sensor diguanylate cyclase n=1 Tax=Marinospirillum alkaliphilum DSM 21637 TaxID=1122209 RepID=A0A1K1TJQ6_9GAMM|nr:diguanylate cyclase [Marinospirillum alkaliphilum]SFX00961.1 periplasmic/7TM domain sensor diguanylate cyclase [Marinospirillum alkaliphilum DSM 21637]